MRFVTVCTFCASRNGPEGRCVLIHRYFYTVYDYTSFKIQKNGDNHAFFEEVKTDSAQYSSNECKNYLLKNYSQHGNILNTI